VDADLLAALLDGRLDEVAREAAIGELAALEHGDLGVFAEATKALRKLEAQDRRAARRCAPGSGGVKQAASDGSRARAALVRPATPSGCPCRVPVWDRLTRPPKALDRR
jgi:hypothetical protein